VRILTPPRAARPAHHHPRHIAGHTAHPRTLPVRPPQGARRRGHSPSRKANSPDDHGIIDALSPAPGRQPSTHSPRQNMTPLPDCSRWGTIADVSHPADGPRGNPLPRSFPRSSTAPLVHVRGGFSEQAAGRPSAGATPVH
jgi:hypothetical protein